MEAGKLALRRIRELIDQRKGFTWETTMSRKTGALWLRRAVEVGYHRKAYFLWVRDPEILIRRIRQRVVEGGHNIAEAITRRRFLKTIQNFFTIYRPLLDGWKLYENDLLVPRLLAEREVGA
jgi:predicted ABC-type ATPase